MSEPIKAYKGLDKDFKCRGHAFEVGQSYHYDGTVSPCNSGFHACENPVDVWTYYGPAESRYAEVELSGMVVGHSGDSKFAASDVKIVREIDGKEFLAMVIARIFGDAKPGTDTSGYSAKIGSSGDYSRIGSSGNSAQIGSSGDYAQIGSNGNSAKIGSSGDYSRIGSSGNSAQIGSSGNSAQIGSSGYSAQIGSSGDYAQIGSSGDYAHIGSSGYYVKINATGQNAVIASAGINVTASGAIGTWISLAEFDANCKCIGFATGCIGQDGLLPGVAYKAKGGKLVPVS